jgi:competence protein ComEC
VAFSVGFDAPAVEPVPLPVGNGSWQARIDDLSSPSGYEQRVFLTLEGADSGPGRAWRLYAWLPRHPALVPGDLVLVDGRVEGPPQDAQGFAGFLASRGAAGTMKATSLELIAPGSDVRAAVEQLRWGIDGALSRALPEPEAGLAAGILVGLRERVSRAVAEEFTTTGLTHVVAISGWNIALVAGIVTGMLRATGLGRRSRSLVVIAAIMGYTLLAGAEASVVRAAVMGGVVLLAREGGRPAGAVAALGLAAWGLLLVDPGMVTDIGLQLSLAATAGLLALGGPAEEAVRRVTAGRAPRWICETLGVSLAAQLATLPLILLHFGRLSLISPLANLLVAPVVPLAMLGALICALVGPLLVAPAVHLVLAPVSLLAWLPLAAMVRGGALLAGVPFASVELPAPFSLLGAGLALAGLSAALLAARRRRSTAPPVDARARAPDRPTGARIGRRRIVAVLATGSLVATISAVLVARHGVLLQVSVLDIGQGDAILVESADGQRMLVDGGPDPDLLVRRLDERIPLWDRHLDLVVLTHPHQDHSAGLAGLVPRYRIDRVAETGMASDGSGVRALRATAAERGIGRVRLTQGDTFALGSARVEVLWPPLDALPETAPSNGREINDTSIVLAMTVGRQRILLTGDLEEDRDAALLEVIGDDGHRWDVLKVAHHGSRTASSRPLLDALRPRLAAISAGEDNDYGHPAPDTLDRLAAVGAAVWRTDRQGTLSVGLEGQPATTAALLRGELAGPCPPGDGPLPLQRAGGRNACYARPDGGAHPSRGALTAHVHVTLATAAAPSDGRRGGSLLPGLPRAAGRHGGGPAPGRDSRAPPRHRQGAASRPSAPVARARRGRRCLAARCRPRRAVSGRGGASGHAPRVTRCVAMGHRRAPRGTHRGLRGQAGHAARRVARAALRALARPACRPRRRARPCPAGRRAARGGTVHGPRHQGGGRGAAELGRRGVGPRESERGPLGRRVSGSSGGAAEGGAPPRTAYFWGEDAFAIERAAAELATRLAPPGEHLDVWRTSADDESGDADGASVPATRRRTRILEAIEEHLATAPLFGAGTLVHLRQPAGLLAESSARDRLVGLVSVIPPGNALCVTDLVAGGARAPAAKGVLRDAIAAAGGLVAEFQVPSGNRLEAWLIERAAQLGSTLEPAAARLLAERTGGHVREGDVDRRRRTELADAELQKLALYRPAGTIGRADVEALVSESVPGSTWAFLDAVGGRDASQASIIAERLLAASTPSPVLVTQLHRRLRELLLVREHLEAGARPPQIVREMKLQPFRAQKLTEQAQRWSLEAIEAALDDLLDLDLRSKGISLDGSTIQMSGALDALDLQAWLARHLPAPHRPSRPR